MTLAGIGPYLRDGSVHSLKASDSIPPHPVDATEFEPLEIRFNSCIAWDYVRSLILHKKQRKIEDLVHDHSPDRVEKGRLFTTAMPRSKNRNLSPSPI